MAEMLTPVDYTRSSTVWASDKWKGVFKVRWIFVRDIPNPTLRHIKLNNTQERKPVTNSRDTQELLPEAGQEMLKIFFTHPARTSLLQDFAFYELQAAQKMAAQQGQGQVSQLAGGSPTTNNQNNQPSPVGGQSGQTGFNGGAGGNMNALQYQMPQMTPMMQMQLMGMNVGGAGGAGGGLSGGGLGGGVGNNQAAMHQSVLRHPSPSPSQQQQNNGGGQQNLGQGRNLMGYN